MNGRGVKVAPEIKNLPAEAAQLRQLVRAARAAGLQRFLYHHQGNLTAGEWAVLSEEWEHRLYAERDLDVLQSWASSR